MRVLVTGATGLIGSAVTHELARRGHAVRVLARPTSDVSVLDRTGAEIARGDILDAASVAAAMAGCDAVVHAAGLVGFRTGQREAMYAVNARGVEIVLGAALAAGVRRAALTSSVSVTGGTRAPRVADEATPSNAEALGIDYFASKLRGEQAGLALVRRGLPLVVLRPGYVLGSGDRRGSSASTILALARRRIRVYVEGGISCCHVADVARGHAEALERGRAGEVYVLAGHNIRVSELVAHVARLTGVPAPRRVPYVVALGAAFASEAAARAGRRVSRVTVDLVRATALYTFASSAKAQRELGYGIRPLEEMLRDTLRFYLASGKLRADTPQLRALAGG